MSERRLLVVNTSRSWGGNEHWAVQVAAGMIARGARVRLLCSSEVVAEPARRAGLDVGRIDLRADGDLPGLWRLRGEMAGFRCETVLLTRWREDLLGGLAARGIGRRRPRVVMRLGLRLIPRQDLKRRLVFRLVDKVVVNAPEIREALLQRPWIAPQRVAVIVNGVDLSAWQPRWEPEAVAAAAAWRCTLGIPAGAPLLLNVGSLTPQKDHAGLLEAMARLRAAWPSARLLILGEGFLRPALEAQRQRLGLQDVVLMPGFATDVRAAMAAADLLVLSSDNEGMARVLCEAAASGLPVVATDVSGTRYAVRHGENGLVVAPRDPPSLAAAADELLADPGRLREMGRRARELAAERFDAERMLDEVAAVLFPASAAAGAVAR